VTYEEAIESVGIYKEMMDNSITAIDRAKWKREYTKARSLVRDLRRPNEQLHNND